MPSPLRQRQVTVKDGTCVLTASQAEALYAEASPRDMTVRDVVAFVASHPKLTVCDFCSQTPVVVTFPAADFQHGLTGDGSKAGWMACQPCRELIDAGKGDDLAVRCERIFCEREAQSPGSIGVAVFRMVHNEFFAHRTGPAVPVEPS